MSTSRKRKASHNPDRHEHRTVNPLSHRSSTLRQFAIAGLVESSPIPSTYGFPHKSLADDGASRDDTWGAFRDLSQLNDDGKGHKTHDAYARQPQASRESRSRTQCVQNLAQILPRLLDNGEMEKARRVFALLARFYSTDGLLGIHKKGLWAIGLELLAHERGASSTHRLNPRHQQSQYTSKVGDLLEELIRRYPWERKLRRDFMSALHFWYVLFGSQIYAVHASYIVDANSEADGLASLHNSREIGSDDDVGGEGHARSDDGGTGVLERKELALSQLGKISTRMDKLLQDQPYSTDAALRALRDVVSSMMVDLATRKGRRGSADTHTKTLFSSSRKYIGSLRDIESIGNSEMRDATSWS